MEQEIESMIKYKTGDLLQAFLNEEVNIIIHGCNAFCKMGAGIAKQIKEIFPEAYEADCQTENGSRSKLGHFSYTHIYRSDFDDQKIHIIINAYTQFTYWDPKDMFSYEAFRSAMREVLGTFGGKNFKFGIPKIGCGLARGDISRVVEILEDEFQNEDLTMYVLSLNEIPNELLK